MSRSARRFEHSAGLKVQPLLMIRRRSDRFAVTVVPLASSVGVAYRRRMTHRMQTGSIGPLEILS
jgi:hypothetical protein